MTADEIISEVRSIAAAMAIPRVHPGAVSGSVRFRVKHFLYAFPFEPWFKKGRKYLRKPGPGVTFELDGVTAAIPIIMEYGGIPGVIDDIAVETCKAIMDHLDVVNWEQFKTMEVFPKFHDWTPEIAEFAIQKAAAELPGLCDKLVEVTPGLQPTTCNVSAKPKRKGVSLRDAATAVNDDAPELWKVTKDNWQQDHRKHLLPTPIGKAESHSQMDLYDLNELCDSIAKLENHELAELCRERLRYKLQDVSETVSKPSGPSAILSNKKKRKTSKT